MKVNRILIPTDFSEQSKSALKLAGFFTKIYGSTIDLIHIVPFSLYMSESMDKMGLPFDMDKDLYPKVVEKAKSELDELASDFIMVDRKPSSAIAEFANKEGYDLILMSAKGAHETNFFKGSITDKVIRKAHAPVFTVSRKYTSSGFERIVTAIDLSEHSLASLALSVELTYQFDTTLKLLYVNQLYSSEGYGFVAPTVGISNEDSNLLFQKRLDDYFNANKELGLSLQKTKQEFEYRIIKNDGASSISVPVHLEVVPGISVPYEITEYANKHADLLIMTTHGRTGIKRVLMGSTAAQVVQQVDVSMLTIRPDNFKLG